MPSPFAMTNPWQDIVLRLAVKWAQTGAPSMADWDEWSQAIYDAHQEKVRSGWDGDDPLWQEALNEGHDSRDEEVEDLRIRAFDGP